METRTHHCGALRPADTGTQVTLMGWVRTRRDHGRLIFLDLWDREGAIQVVADLRSSPDAYAVAQTLRDEYVVAVRGTVEERPRGTVNPGLLTGEVEVVADAIEILNATQPLPFPVEDAPDVDDALRLRYRYLDLRRTALQRNFRLRHRVVKMLRDVLDAEGFLEVETPVLTRSTPEGARDYLVPSRIHPGEFYALPQSPQQMKQLLMVAGFDRYYQVARCFRDEDLRADRQPEFTQLDLEMSFVGQEEVLSLVETVIAAAVRDATPEKHMPAPFRRMTYDEAMLRYGTDKPDLRFGMLLTDCTAYLAQGGAPLFAGAATEGSVVKGICVPGYGAAPAEVLDALRSLGQEVVAGSVAWLSVAGTGLDGPSAQGLTPERQQTLIAAFEAHSGDLLLWMRGAPAVIDPALDGLRREMGQRLGLADPDQLAFAWIVDFPLFKWDAEGKRWDAQHHLFTGPKPEDLARFEADPGAARASCYDLVCNGWELGSGSIRIHQRELQERVLKLLGYSPERAEADFGHLMEAFQYGAPPHGGFGVGIDRLVAILAGTDTIRDVIAFPKTRQASDLTMRAPAPVEKTQLDALHIRVR